MSKPDFSKYEERIKDIPLYREGKPPLTTFTPDFKEELTKTWGKQWGGQSSYAKLRAVVVHRPGSEADWGDADPGFFNLPTGQIDTELMRQQHDNFVKVLNECGVETIPLEAPDPVVGTYGIPLRSATFTHETLMVKGGAIICRCSSAYKRGLEYYQYKTVAKQGCPTLYTVHGMGWYESSMSVWLDKNTLPLSIGLRGNQEGVRQVMSVVRDFDVTDTPVVHLPSALNRRESQNGGGGGAFHLDMVFGVAGPKIGVIYPECVGYEFVDYLLHEKDFDLIEIPPEEVNNVPANFLVVEPGKLIIPEGSPYVCAELRKRGIECIEIPFSEFADGGGGPTCATMPILRDDE